MGASVKSLLQPISKIFDPKEGYQRNGPTTVGASILYQWKENKMARLYVVRLYNYINPFHFLSGENLKQSLIFERKKILYISS